MISVSSYMIANMIIIENLHGLIKVDTHINKKKIYSSFNSHLEMLLSQQQARVALKK